MYDTTKSKITLENLPQAFFANKLQNIDWGGFLWRPVQNKQTHIIGHQTELQNLKLRLFGSDLQIENSLQKFYMGNNHEEFTYSMVVEAIEKLNNLLPFDVYNAKLSQADVGVVINHDTEQETSRWLDYKGTKPMPMLSRNRVYGCEIRKTDYKFKAYDKTFEAQKTAGTILQEKLMRVELRGNNRYFNNRANPIGMYTVRDLIDPIKYQLMGNEFLNFYTAIKKKPNLDFSIWSTKDLRLYGCMNYDDTANAMKRYHKDTYKKERAQYLKLLANNQDAMLEDVLFNKLKEKVDFSINN